VQNGHPFSAIVSVGGIAKQESLSGQSNSNDADLSSAGSARNFQNRYTADFTFIQQSPTESWLLATITPAIDSARRTVAEPLDGDSLKLHVAISRLASSLEAWSHCPALVGDSLYVSRLQKQAKAASEHLMEFTIVGPPGTGREALAREIMRQRQLANANLPESGDLVAVHGYLADVELMRTCIAQSIELAKEKAIESSNRTDKVQPWLMVLNADQLDAAAQAELWAKLRASGSRLKVIATSETDLLSCVCATGFHSGLAHLLTTQTIQTIPLCDHLADLPMVVQHEVERCNVTRTKSIQGFSNAAMQLMTDYSWSGNLAEVASIVSAAAVACDGREIDVVDLPEKFRFAIAAQRRPAQTVVEIDLEKYLGEIELKLVRRALTLAKGNKTKAAKLLGVSRAKLLRRIQPFQLQPSAQDLEAPLPVTSVDGDLSADDFRPLDEPLFEEADDFEPSDD
jgi:hypothetical protein